MIRILEAGLAFAGIVVALTVGITRILELLAMCRRRRTAQTDVVWHDSIPTEKRSS